MGAEEGSSRKESFKSAQLSSHDDVITDALVDKVYFWATIRKNRARYSASRGIKEEDVTKILHEHVVLERDPETATDMLMELPGLKKYHQKLSRDDRTHFQRHLRRYVDIYLPDCPIEVTTTNRYTIDTNEAAITARRYIRKGILIRYLTGIQAPITKEEEKKLGSHLDFSIVMSSRKRTPSLFLGPARFANHDCNANAKLTITGSNGMSVVAVRDIAQGEEVTVSYGENYFGLDNCECLCATCETHNRNGWNSTLPRSIEGDSPGFLIVKKRKTASPEQLHKNKQQKRDHAWPVPSIETMLDPPLLDSETELQLEEIRDTRPQRFILPSTSSTSRGASPTVSPKKNSQELTSTAATSVPSPLPSSDALEGSPPQWAKTGPLEVPLIPIMESAENMVASHGLDLAATICSGMAPGGGTTCEAVAAISVTPSADVHSHDSEEEDDASKPGLNRKPGDYTLTPLLLVQPMYRWVKCRVCESDFVQDHAFQTRAACPRCERHLKLYGYTWPKTICVGGSEFEERIDPRTVNRFVDPTEEKDIRKGKGNSLRSLLIEREGSDRLNSARPEDQDPSQGRLRRRYVRPAMSDFDFEDTPPPKRKRIENVSSLAANTGNDKVTSFKPNNADAKRSKITIKAHKSAGKPEVLIKKTYGSGKLKSLASLLKASLKQRKLSKPTTKPTKISRLQAAGCHTSWSKKAEVVQPPRKRGRPRKVDQASPSAAPDNRPRWHGIPVAAASKKSKAASAAKPRPSWQWADPEKRPVFAAPPSPPPIRSKAIGKHARQPKARKPREQTVAKVARPKHSFYYVPDSVRPSKAAPPFPDDLLSSRSKSRKLKNSVELDSEPLTLTTKYTTRRRKSETSWTYIESTEMDIDSALSSAPADLNGTNVLTQSDSVPTKQPDSSPKELQMTPQSPDFKANDGAALPSHILVRSEPTIEEMFSTSNDLLNDALDATRETFVDASLPLQAPSYDTGLEPLF